MAQRTRIFCRWLSQRPPILYYGSKPDYDIGAELPPGRAYRLARFHWHRNANGVQREYLARQERRPQDVFHYLVNERELCRQLERLAVPATLSSSNAMLDESIFRILPEEDKSFDAVYVARMAPFKRHSLAWRLKSLLMIGGVRGFGDSHEYFHQLRTAMPHAHFTHAVQSSWIPPEQVARLLNRSRVGLCLSAEEGAMYATTEYLLCGLPVVSTVSLGGRSEWFDPDFVRVVPADAEAIQMAVQELITLQIPPDFIRERTMRRMQEHRDRFFAVVQAIYDREGVGRDFACEWPQRFRHKMGRWRGLGEVSAAMADDLS